MVHMRLALENVYDGPYRPVMSPKKGPFLILFAFPYY
jgi:hypothetical protein